MSANSDKLVLLTGIYPFARGRRPGGKLAARIHLNLLVILGYKVTFAGSELLNDRFAQEMLAANEALFSEGLVIPDLRHEVSTFEDLAVHHFPRAISLAKVIDQKKLRTVGFSPSSVSQEYRSLLDEYLLRAEAAADSPLAEKFAISREKLVLLPDPLGLAAVKRILPNSREFSGPRRMFEYLYCTTGADIVGADVLFDSIYRNEHDVLSQLSHGNLIDRGGESVLEYFALNPRLLARLSPEAVIALRNDIRVEQAANEIRSIAQRVVREHSVAGAHRGGLEAAQESLRAYVREACEKEARGRRIEEWSFDTVYDQVPFSSLLRRGVSTLEATLARAPKVAWLARTSAPLTHFAHLLRQKLEGVPT